MEADESGAMKNGNNEFLGLLCNLYLVALLVALPLYTGKGYWSLGDTKYMLFKNLSLLCLGIWLAAALSMGIWRAAKRAGSRSAGAGRRREPGMVDAAVASYGICVLLSALRSEYGGLAWTGYEGWYMGAVSQLLFVGIYFFVSRQYDGARWPLYLGEAALGLVTLFGLLHRLGIDPLRLLVHWNPGDWEYSHMLSTLGNINWLCGYYSVALALPAAHFLLEPRPWARLLLYVEAVAAFVLLGVQGSQGGLLILAVCAAGCFVLGRRRAEVLTRLWALLAGFFLCMPLMELGMELRKERAAVVADGNVFWNVAWYVWAIAGVVCLGACLLSAKRRHAKVGQVPEERGSAKVGQIPGERGSAKVGQVPWERGSAKVGQVPWERTSGKKGHVRGSSGPRRQGKKALIAVAAVCLAGCLAAALLILASRGIGDGFGSGRGFLWRIALEGFVQGDMKDKLLGAGPDCYGVAVFGRLGTGSDVWKGEHWEGAVFTNAHNEVLSQLCNVGILGTVSYLAIFLAGLWRYGMGSAESRRSPVQSRGGGPGKDGGALAFPADSDACCLWAGVLAIAMYGAHSLISFQQVLNTPLLFLVLGVCEQRMRARRGASGPGNDGQQEGEKANKYRRMNDKQNIGKRRTRP
nr:hypothetical protein [uncultured Acetatifactor sp.]